MSTVFGVIFGGGDSASSTVSWQDLIDRARLYSDDDPASANGKGWIQPAMWMTLLQVEYRYLYARWVRSGLQAPTPVDVEFTGPYTDLTGVLALVGVARVTSPGNYELLQPSQSREGRAPIRSTRTGVGVGWSASGTGDSLRVSIDSTDTGTYLVRYIARPELVTNPALTVNLPYGADERLVLGATRRAHLKDSTTSALLERLLLDADAELNMVASRVIGDAARIRRVDERPLNFTTWRYY